MNNVDSFIAFAIVVSVFFVFFMIGLSSYQKGFDNGIYYNNYCNNIDVDYDFCINFYRDKNDIGNKPLLKIN